jgi:hypothetical protein
MHFNWLYYLEVAQELTDQAKDALPELQEAKCRAAISRAYYAVLGQKRVSVNDLNCSSLRIT